MFVAAIICERPDTDSEMMVNPDQDSYSYNEVITYSCTDWWKLVGNATRTCDTEKNNTWIEDSPHCQRKIPMMNSSNISDYTIIKTIEML